MTLEPFMMHDLQATIEGVAAFIAIVALCGLLAYSAWRTVK